MAKQDKTYVVKKERKYFGVPKMIGWSYLKSFGGQIISSAKSLTKPAQPEREETFEEAMQRLKLTEADIEQRKNNFLKFCIGFAVVAFLIFAYSIYLFWASHFAGGLIGLSVTAITLTQVFKYHFWYFQMKKRKLGCTLKEWFNS